MAVRTANAVWEGNLREGKGTMKFGGGAFEGAYSHASRFADGPGTNPEELLGAAHAGCFSMSLSSGLTKAGFTARRIETKATVTLESVEGKSRITHIHLDTDASVPGVAEAQFQEIAENSKLNCPVSAALTGVKITLTAHLLV